MLLKNVRRLCADNHITIKELERETGLGNGVIARWGEGKAQLRGVLKVAEYFGVSLDELVTGKANSYAPPTKEQLIDRMLLLMEGAGLTLVEAEDVADELVKAVDRLNSEAYEKMLFHREYTPELSISELRCAFKSMVMQLTEEQCGEVLAELNILPQAEEGNGDE